MQHIHLLVSSPCELHAAGSDLKHTSTAAVGGYFAKLNIEYERCRQLQLPPITAANHVEAAGPVAAERICQMKVPRNPTVPGHGGGS